MKSTICPRLLIQLAIHLYILPLRCSNSNISQFFFFIYFIDCWIYRLNQRLCIYRLFWFQYKSQPYHFVEKYFFYYIQFSSVILSFSIHLKEENNKSPAISLSRIHFDESWTKINEIAWKWLDIKWVRESELLFIWYSVARFLYYLVFLSSAKAIYHFDENSSLNGLTPSTKSFFSFFLSFSFSRSVFGINEWLLIDCIDIQSDRKAISNEISMHIPTHTHIRT